MIQKNGLHGAFTILQVNGKYAFIRREHDGLWDIPGGGYSSKEINYKKVARRELIEEMAIRFPHKYFRLCGILGQKLKKVDSLAYGGVTHGYAYLHYIILYKEPVVTLSEEHTEYRLFSYEEVISNYKDFKSGPLWLFFTFLEFQRTNEIQEGLLRDRMLWQGKEYR